MMASEDDGIGPRKRRKIGPQASAPYVLRQLLDEVPLSAEDGTTDVHITCVEYWNENLYIGTSAAEILHFVCLPPEPSSDINEPSFILATRLPLPYPRNPSSTASQHGIQQILLLPTVNKACILCNGVVTFYLLPELSPAFGNTKVSNCCWIGGVDLNRSPDDADDPVIMIGHQNRIMLVRIREEARLVKNIPFSGCLVASRRGTIACAADARAYSLLELEHQQKIPLFPISSSEEVFESGHSESLAPQNARSSAKRSPSSSYPSPPPRESHSHARSSSLNTVAANLQPNNQTDRLRPATPDQLRRSESTSRSQSRERERDQSSARNSPDITGREPQSNVSASSKPLPPVPKPAMPQLMPHILSPTNSEFLLVTGTEKSEPGVGMFVNVDGDVVRGTLQFDKYPAALVIDIGNENDSARPTGQSRKDNDDNILAVIEVKENDEVRRHLEIQHWDVGPGDDERQKFRVQIPSATEAEPAAVGISHTISSSQLDFPELGKLLQMVRLKTPTLSPHVTPGDPRTQESIEQHQKEKELFESQELGSTGSSESAWEVERNAEEAKFAGGLGKIRSSLVLWSGKQIWRVVRNPSTIRLDDAIRSAEEVKEDGSRLLHRDSVVGIIESLRDVEPKSEAEFLGFNYVKQKASLLLFADLLTMDAGARSETIIQETETALLAGNLDPRVVVMLIPLLHGEVLQGPQGIWINAGLAATAEECIQRVDRGQTSTANEAVETAVLDMLKRFLLAWQQKRGYGSITDETYVFDSVDASLLHLLLELDSPSRRKRGFPKSVRAELHNLVSKWKGNFERAVLLIEEYRRLYVLSVLYQSRRMSGNVLKTWRRIVEGERDDSGEVTATEIESKMRNYLVRIKDAQLVEEYGSWLAARNPGLGIRVFADKESRVKLDPAEVVKLLKERAPNAVQDYLEHLVFTKNYTQYIDDLISYYLDNVLMVLESSASAQASLSESYATYRALRPPKPTYINFITENLPAETWWQSRLRLLQLLGAGSGSQFAATPTPAALNFSIPAVLSRIEPFQNELVSECIILDGLQGRHQQALRLLTHGLGDYDSAVRYCLFGGPRSTTPSGSMAEFAARSTQTELFRYLLDEFLQIHDISERIERTSDLLARFAGWFDVREVLRVVPNDWSVEILGGFFSHVFRALISESREVKVERALSASLNLRVGCEYIEGVEKAGGWIEDDTGLHKLTEKSSRDVHHRQPLNAEDTGDFGEMITASGIPGSHS